MSKLLETIKIINGIAPFLTFHQQRLNESRQQLFQTNDEIDLDTVIQAPSTEQIYRCRVIYGQTIEKVEYLPYKIKKFNCFKVIAANALVYEFKYLDRTQINQLIASKGAADEILIIKNGLVTDTSIANVAFWRQNQWLTPATPLLKGTTRQRWLSTGRIEEAEIKLTDLNTFTKMALMNALMDFTILENFNLLF
jgi:4-amino-4-deoxychorismate lyase